MDVLIAVVVILGVLLVLAGVGLAITRRQATGWDQSRADLRQQAATIHRRLQQALKELADDPGEPYAPMIKEGRTLAQAGTAALDRARAQLSQPPAANLAANPAWKLALVVPMATELGQRLAWWWRWRSARRTVRRAEQSLTRTQGALGNLAGVSKAEKRATLQLRQQAIELKPDLEANNQGGALDAELAKLAEAMPLLDRIDQLLAGAEPTQARVIQAYPLRIQAAGLVDGAAASLKHHQRQHTRLTPALEGARRKLAELEAMLQAEEEGAGRPAPVHREKIAALRKRYQDLEKHLARGAFKEVETGAPALSGDILETQGAFGKIRKERDKTAAEREVVKARLEDQRNWVKAAGPSNPEGTSQGSQRLPVFQYEMDLAQAWITRLQDRTAALDRLLTSESAADFQKDRSLSLLPIDREHEEFKRNRVAYEALRPRYTPSAFQEVNSHAIDLIADLKDRHASYQAEARLTGLVERRNLHEAAWERLSAVTTLPESQLKEILANLNALHRTHEALKQDCIRAEQVLGRVHADFEGARAALDDPIFLQCERIRQDCDAYLTEQVEPLCARIGTYQGSLTRRDEDFKSMASQLGLARVKARRLIEEYQTRLEKASSEVITSTQSLVQLDEDLGKLAGIANLDYEDRLGPARQEIAGWLAQSSRVTQSSLRELSAYAQTGGTLLARAREIHSSLNADITRVETARREVMADVLAADRAITEAQLAQDNQPAFKSRPGAISLRDARQLLQQARTCLQELDHPAQRLRPAEAARLLESARGQASAAAAAASEFLKAPD